MWLVHTFVKMMQEVMCLELKNILEDRDDARGSCDAKEHVLRIVEDN